MDKGAAHDSGMADGIGRTNGAVEGMRVALEIGDWRLEIADGRGWKRGWGGSAGEAVNRLHREIWEGKEEKEKKAGYQPAQQTKERKKTPRRKKSLRRDSFYQGATLLISRGNMEHSLTLAMPRKQAVIRSRPMAKPP